jgi:hypothetical protein
VLYAIMSVIIVAVLAAVMIGLVRYMFSFRRPLKIRRLCGLHAAKAMRRGEWAALDTYGCEVCRKVKRIFNNAGPGGAA